MKILGIVVLVLVLAVAGIGIYVAVTFDVNSLKTMIEDQLESATGFDMRLGRMKLVLGLTPALDVDGISVKLPGESAELAKAKKVTIQADLTKLAAKNIAISKFILVEPEIFVLHKKDTTWNWTQKNLVAAKTVHTGGDLAGEVSKQPDVPQRNVMPAPKSDWDFSIEQFNVLDAKLHFVEQTVEPEYQVILNHLNVDSQFGGRQAPVKIDASAKLELAQSQPVVMLKGFYDIGHQTLSFNLDYDKQTLTFEGVLGNLTGVPQFQGKIMARGLNLESLVPENRKSGEYVSGILTADLDGSFIGFHPQLLKNTLTLEGAVDIRDGAIKNINFIRQVLYQMDSIPGMSQMLSGKMPEEITQLTQSEHTPFERLESSLRVFQGRLYVDSLDVKHPLFYISAEGDYGMFESDLNGAAKLVLLDEISSFMTQKIYELRYVTNSQNRLVIPFQFRGIVPGVSVYPDLTAFTKQVLQTQGQELISQGLAKLSEILAKKTGMEEPSPEQTQPADSEPVI